MLAGVMLALIGVGVHCHCAYAVDAPEVTHDRMVTVSERIHFTSEVERVILLVSAHGKLLESKYVAWLPHSESSDISCIGRIALPPEPTLLQLLFVIFGPRGEVRSAFKTIESEELSPTEQLSLSELQDRLVERRGIVRKLATEAQFQGERLRALQDDADAIANVSKIVNTEDELLEVKAKLKRIEAGFASIQQRSERMKTRGAPLNARTREAALVDQLAELSTALAASEAKALKGVSGASTELKRKLRLIEETRDEHLVLLEEELAELQKR